MAVVTYGYMSYRLGHVWWLAAIALSGFIGVTRIYAGSRFIHQVVLSWLTGACSLLFYITRYEQFVPDWGENISQQKVRMVLMAPWVLGFLAYLCLALEDNSSSLFRIPNSEFIRVMSDIMDSGPAPTQTVVEEPLGSESRGLVNRLNSRSTERRQQYAARRDSFFFLQRSIQSKDNERKSLNARNSDEQIDS